MTEQVQFTLDAGIEMPSSHKINFTRRQIERLKELKAEGWRNKEIGRIMGVSESTIAAYLRRERGEKAL